MLTSRRHVPALLGTLATVAATVTLTAAPSHADGPTTFTSATAIDVPASGSADQRGQANPYPSTISVSGVSGPVSTVQVSLNGLTHDSVGDLDVMLVSPTGATLVLMSDVGDPDALSFSFGADLTFSDSAATGLSAGLISSGTYRPTDNDPSGLSDTFPAPAPAPSAATTLAGAFTGTTANGDWKLYAVDDASGDTGQINGGWSLTLTTSVSAAATTTTVTSSANPSQEGASVTFAATVSSGAGTPTGNVTFSAGGSNLGDGAVGRCGAGHADDLDAARGLDGGHRDLQRRPDVPDQLRLHDPGRGPPDRARQQAVLQPRGHRGAQRRSGDAVRVPHHRLRGRPGTSVTGVRVALPRTSGTPRPVDLDVMVVAPNGQSAVLMSDTGGAGPVSGRNVAFQDAQPQVGDLSNPSTGPYGPTNLDDGGSDAFPAPAPAPTTTTLNDLGTSPNGVWSLYVNDDALGDSGSISSWCVRLISQPGPPPPRSRSSPCPVPPAPRPTSPRP